MTQPKRILLVEDEPDILRIASTVLRGAGYDVVPGFGGEDGWRKLKSQPFDLLITDLAMPGLSGPDLIARVRSDPELAQLPILALTAFVWDEIAREATNVGCEHFLAKPFTAAQLLRAVETALNWGVRRAHRPDGDELRPADLHRAFGAERLRLAERG